MNWKVEPYVDFITENYIQKGYHPSISNCQKNRLRKKLKSIKVKFQMPLLKMLLSSKVSTLQFLSVTSNIKFCKKFRNYHHHLVAEAHAMHTTKVVQRLKCPITSEFKIPVTVVSLSSQQRISDRKFSKEKIWKNSPFSRLRCFLVTNLSRFNIGKMNMRNTQ